MRHKKITYTSGFLALLLGGAYFVALKPVDTNRFPASNHHSRQIECKYDAHDIERTIVGYGNTLHEARAQASELCFEARLSFYESRDPSSEEYMERGLSLIDSCVNITCS